jgi:hypothetical protein
LLTRPHRAQFPPSNLPSTPSLPLNQHHHSLPPASSSRTHATAQSAPKPCSLAVADAEIERKKQS